MEDDRKEKSRAEAFGAAARPGKRPAEGAGASDRPGHAPAGFGGGERSAAGARPCGGAYGVPESRSGRYDLMRDEAGHVLLLVDACEGEPEDPRLVYDGGDRMVFHRSRLSACTIDGLEVRAREALAEVSEVTVAEIGGEDVVREYGVELCRVGSLETLIGTESCAGPADADRRPGE